MYLKGQTCFIKNFALVFVRRELCWEVESSLLFISRYVPAIADKWLLKTDLPIKLKGIGIGDGFTDPLAVISEMPGFGYNLGLLDYQER